MRGREGGRTRKDEHHWSPKPKQQVIGQIKHLKIKTRREDGVSLERLMCALMSKEGGKRSLCLQVRDEEEKTTTFPRSERDQSNRDPWIPDQMGQH